jgi:hypothetical protein
MNLIYSIFFWILIALIFSSQLYVMMGRRGPSTLDIPTWLSWIFIGTAFLQAGSNFWDWLFGKEIRWPVVYRRDLEEIEFYKILKQVAQSNVAATISDKFINDRCPIIKLNLRKIINKTLILSGLDPIYYNEDKQGVFEKKLRVAGVLRKVKFKIKYIGKESSLKIFT